MSRSLVDNVDCYLSWLCYAMTLQQNTNVEMIFRILYIIIELLLIVVKNLHDQFNSIYQYNLSWFAVPILRLHVYAHVYVHVYAISSLFSFFLLFPRLRLL